MRYNIFFKFMIGLSFVVILLPTNVISAESSVQSKANFKVLPNHLLFTIDNMKPGDWAPRSVVVKNEGLKKIKYQMTLQNNGPRKLFNELMLEIKDNQMELYNGKMAEFKSLALRSLPADSEEELQITVRFPEGLGNNFQGLKADIVLLFTTKGNKISGEDVSVGGLSGSGDDQPKNGSVLPATATNLFNVLFVGGLLLGFGGLLIMFNQFKQYKSLTGNVNIRK